LLTDFFQFLCILSIIPLHLRYQAAAPSPSLLAFFQSPVAADWSPAAAPLSCAGKVIP
jgi:hypothetical protein